MWIGTFMGFGDKKALTWEDYPPNDSIHGDGDLVKEVTVKADGYSPNSNQAKSKEYPNVKPKTKLFRRALLDKLQDNPDRLYTIIEKALREAEDGNIAYFTQLRDMLDGKPANRSIIEDEDSDPPQKQVDDIDARLNELLGQTGLN